MRDYSNFHNDSFKDKLLRDGVKAFERSLPTSPDSYLVIVDDEEKYVMIQSTANYNERRVLFKKDDLAWGDTIIHEDEKWLVTERPFFNKIHEKSHIQLCNTQMEFITLTEGVFEYDRRGNKIWIEEPIKVVVTFPCAVESISNLNTKTTTGAEINVPEGDMVLQLSYTENELIEMGNEFTMFENSYRISGIDRSKVHNSQGVLVLVVSRVSNKS